MNAKVVTLDRSHLLSLLDQPLWQAKLPVLQWLKAQLAAAEANCGCPAEKARVSLSEADINEAKRQLAAFLPANPAILAELKQQLGADQLRIKFLKQVTGLSSTYEH